MEQILDKYSVAGLWTLYTCLHIIPYISLYIDIYVYIYMMQEFVQCLNSSDLFYFSLRITEVFIIITLKGSDLYVQHIYSGVSLLGHNSTFQPSVFGFLVLSCTSYEDDTFFCRYPIWINLWIKACWLYRSSCCLIQMSISILIDESFVWRILFSPDYHPVDCVSLMVVKESGLWAA